MRWLRYAAPISLSLFGVWLLVGCIYLPIPEHSTNWSQKNFFPLLDPNNTSSPIRRGQINRMAIIKLLGRPAFELPDRQALVYRYDSERDVTIWPLCFVIQPGYRDSFAVKFNFDGNGQLIDWETAHTSARYLGGGAIQSPILSGADATEAFRPKPPEPDTAPTVAPATNPSPP